MNNPPHMALAIVGGERYIVLYPPDRKLQACAAAMKWACNPELNFTFRDCCKLSYQISCKQPVEMRQ